MCVHPEGGSGNPANGTAAVLWADCTNASRLGFRLRDTGSIQHIESGKCLHPEGGSAFPSPLARLVFWEGCDEPRLKFEVTSRGQLRHVSSGKCLAPMAYDPAIGEYQGQYLVFAECSIATDSQIFGSVNF
jgi:hypothetical protein